MKERTKLLKKAVLTGVGATANVDRVKSALNDALNDLMKVGQDLLEELEEKGKVKTDSVQNFLKNLQEDATKQAESFSNLASNKVQTSVLKAANELGLVSREEFLNLVSRVEKLENNKDCLDKNSTIIDAQLSEPEIQPDNTNNSENNVKNSKKKNN